MSTGDKVLSTRVNANSNERLDLLDFLAQSQTAQLVIECAQRALLSSPKATAGTATGERWTGSLTANPTSGADGLFRLDNAAFVGLDANGGLVLSPFGTAISIAIPAGGTSQQVYAYMSDITLNTQVRRFIPATTPFTEFTQAINVALQQSCNLYVRAGTFGSVVASDVVAGATRPLLFLGICTNTGGVVTFAPAANTLETVSQPVAFPTTSSGITVAKTTTTGSQATLRELINAALYQIGQLGFAGSSGSPPNAGNNFQAYGAISRGLTALFDASAEATVTPITAWRDYLLDRRSLIDHNGYRMGQVTERDQTWDSSLIVLSVLPGESGVAPLFGLAVPTASGWATALGALEIAAVNEGFNISPGLPVGATITQVQVTFTPGSNTDTVRITAIGAGANSGAGTLCSVFTPTGSIATQTAVVAQNNPGVSLPQTIVPGGQFVCGVSSQAANPSSITGGTFIVQALLLSIYTDPDGWLFVPSVSNNSAGGQAGLCQATREYNDPNVNINQRTARLITRATTNAGVNVSGTLSPIAYEAFMNSDVAYVQEWIARTGTITDATNNRIFALGVQNNNGGAGNNFILFFNTGLSVGPDNTMTNWNIRIIGNPSSFIDVDTGVPIAANTTYRMRLEILGSKVSSAGAGNFRARSFINGVKVTDSIVSTWPVADMIRPWFQIGTSSGTVGGPYDFTIGRLRRVWNHLLVGDNL